ncbi:PhnE/PtxC family ABC transporter permease [Arthrobacter sp. FW306-2-2C-D06B]|uniref:PhnE/PtxC family ABC transporter permease n=1 Tax=Arthrobacter sp. FW306-2-2C-D06B TaxID=2879618 RepID=UPI001F031758|nr:ABC transporter permease subunit [Arthrobacter sp. FW306-2-2C-D06B]UKA59853.1 ABC transporter permease subunit [Arthrobacter sp. FW306-2-2C-D06B]
MSDETRTFPIRPKQPLRWIATAVAVAAVVVLHALANRIQQVANATLPMVVPQFVGLLLYRFDVNVRSSLVLGLVGAGGIGLLINQSIKSFRFDAMLTHIIIVLVLIIVVDQFSAWVRRKLAA